MKYYVITDPHGFYTLTCRALAEAGFFAQTEPHRLVLCGDLQDRGSEPREMQRFMLDLHKAGNLIYIRGNHEDLLERLIEDLLADKTELLLDGSSYHIENGTWDTALQLTGMRAEEALRSPHELARLLQATPMLRTLLPSALDYFETERYVFTHGYLPCGSLDGGTVYREGRLFFLREDWREASAEAWRHARWYDGMRFACEFGLTLPQKTVVCGHRAASYGHAYLHGQGVGRGEGAITTPFYDLGIIGLDAGTVWSGRVNCLVLED